MRRMEWILLTQLNSTRRGWVYFEQHIPKNSWGGISDHFPVNVLCQHQSTDHWSREDASLLPLKETRPSPFQSHIQGQNCQVGGGGGGVVVGVQISSERGLARIQRQIWNYKQLYVTLSFRYGFYWGNYLNYLITDQGYQCILSHLLMFWKYNPNSVYTEPLTYVLEI